MLFACSETWIPCGANHYNSASDSNDFVKCFYQNLIQPYLAQLAGDKSELIELDMHIFL